jgi:integrase
MIPKYVWLEKRPHGWLLRWQDSFKEKRSQFFTDRFAARGQAKMLIEQIKAQRMEEAFHDDPMTVERAVEIFICTYPCQENSKRVLRYAFRDFQRHFPGRDVRSIRPLEMDAFRCDQAKRYRPKTFAYLGFYLKKLFAWLKQNLLIVESPTAHWKILHDYHSAGRLLSYRDEFALLEVTPPQHLPKLLAGLDAGLHSAEIAALTRASFDFDAHTIHYQPGKPKTRKDELTLPLTERFETALLRYFADPQAKWLSRQPYRRPDKPDWFEWLRERAGLELVCRDLRHTFYTRLEDASGNELLTEYAIGHLVRLNRYTYYHPRMEILREAFRKMEEQTLNALATIAVKTLEKEL